MPQIHLFSISKRTRQFVTRDANLHLRVVTHGDKRDLIGKQFGSKDCHATGRDIKARIYGRDLSRQLIATFVALKLYQVSNMLQQKSPV